MAEPIQKGDPEYQRLLDAWMQQGQPPRISLPNGQSYKVLRPEEGVVKFAPLSDQDQYGSLSM